MLRDSFEHELEAAEQVWQISNAWDERREAREGLRIKRRRAQQDRTLGMSEEDAAIHDVIEEEVAARLKATRTRGWTS